MSKIGAGMTSVIRPIPGRPHCGDTAPAVGYLDESAGRSSVGRLCSRTCLSSGRPGRLHCGQLPGVLAATMLLIARPLPRPAPLRRASCVLHLQRLREPSGRSPAGSTGQHPERRGPPLGAGRPAGSPVGSTAAAIPSTRAPRPNSVIRPVLGRFHCGTMHGPWFGPWSTSSGRSPAGSITAASPTSRTPIIQTVIGPVLGPLCGAIIPRSVLSSRKVIRPAFRPAPLRPAERRHNDHRRRGHPADSRPAPLRQVRLEQGVDVEPALSGRFLAGSAAANPSPARTPAAPGSSGRSLAGSIAGAPTKCSRTPTSGRVRSILWSAPLRGEHVRAQHTLTERVVRLILGRPHCGMMSRMSVATSLKSSGCSIPAWSPRRRSGDVRMSSGRSPAGSIAARTGSGQQPRPYR
jgi:hypothetical protein